MSDKYHTDPNPVIKIGVMVNFVALCLEYCGQSVSFVYNNGTTKCTYCGTISSLPTMEELNDYQRRREGRSCDPVGSVHFPQSREDVDRGLQSGQEQVS